MACYRELRLVSGFLLAVAFTTHWTTGSVRGDDAPSVVTFPDGWSPQTPREELRPDIRFDPEGGPDRSGSFVIRHDDREGLDGWVQKVWPVTGGQFVRFQAVRRLERVAVPRRSALVRILWQDDAGDMVTSNVPEEQPHRPGPVPTAEPEHPVDGAMSANGWTTVSGVYHVPVRATRAIVELHLQWAPGGSAEWSGARLVPCDAPVARRVRLATIHHRPSGRSPRENCTEYSGLLASAAKQRADLVVLGETIPSVGVNSPPHVIAEPVPGPATEIFGELARQHGLHLVFSLYEREQHLVFNTAVLIGPDGKLIGKYRKVCLPHGEVEQGIAPGNDYPVFETPLGRIGMMVCYDGFFPEVARQLTVRGADIIAWPVWGCNPQLARARAAENHVFIVSSTYMSPADDWMLSAVYDPFGNPVAQAEDRDSVVVAEVDLSRPAIGPWNLGDFHSMIERHRPVSAAETRPPGPHPAATDPEDSIYIDTSFENASPLWWDVGADGVIAVHLTYDHERNSPNRAAGHLHFALEAQPGTRHTIEFMNLDNIYNGRHGSVAGELKRVMVSDDGHRWQSVATRALPGNRVQLDVQLTGSKLYVARVEPYRLSDLERWLSQLTGDSRVAVTTIGRTVEGRDLEIVRVGKEDAPYHVFIRARAHPWEAGGNWVAQGLVNRLLEEDAAAAAFRERYCLWLLPMANKDGVARGRTRFNMQGVDLNRGWDRRADPATGPENAALEDWLEHRIAAGFRPSLALELHNDGSGKLHAGRPAPMADQDSVQRIQILERLLRERTWFTEGIKLPASGDTTFTLADGLVQRFEITAAVHEFNCHWVAGLNEPANAKHWQDYGANLAQVIDDYLAAEP